MELPNPSAEFYRHFYPEQLYLVSEPLPGMAATEEAGKNQPESAGPVASGATEAVPAAVPPKEPPFATAGGNRKRVAVVFNMMPADFAGIAGNPLLLKILAAVQLSADDVLLVNLTGPVDNLTVLYDALPIDQSILFLAANHALVLKHKLKPFQPMSVGGKYVLSAAELSGLQASNEMKKQLWTGLQAMFL